MYILLCQVIFKLPYLNMLVLNRIISDIQLVSLNIFTPKKKANKNKKEKQKIFIVLGVILSREGGWWWRFFLALMFTVYL